MSLDLHPKQIGIEKYIKDVMIAMFEKYTTEIFSCIYF